MHKHKILIVEDDANLGPGLKNNLAEAGFETELAYDGLLAEKLFAVFEPHVVVLDINIPVKNGFTLCKELKLKRECQILMLTALGDIQDKIDAFDAGADDYLVKPFHISELIARIKILCKRSLIKPNDRIINIADLCINLIDKTVTRNNVKISVTVKEFALLELLAASNGRVVSKQEIAEEVWDLNFDTGTNTIEVYVSFLRNKIDKNYEVKLIHTRPGFGYYLKAEK